MIFASYSWARLDHMVRFTLGLPFRVASASCMVLSEESLRMPTLSALLVGTLRVIFSFSKRSTYSSSCMPAISVDCSSITRPTPCLG